MPVERSLMTLVLAMPVVLGGATSTMAQGEMRLFEGTHDAGGELFFSVSADSSQISTLGFEGIAGGGCSWSFITLEN